MAETETPHTDLVQLPLRREDADEPVIPRRGAPAHGFVFSLSLSLFPQSPGLSFLLTNASFLFVPLFSWM